MAHLVARQHIQDHNEPNTTEKYYWAYATRVLPCTKDAGTCEYLDAVYSMHETSMLYTFIMWAVIGGTLALWAIARIWRAGRASLGAAALLFELCDGVTVWKRKLLPDAPGRRLWGRISRLQVVVLTVILAYLAVFSFVGIVYRTWVTPIKGSTLHNTRTGLGGWSDRIGALAYALTPLAVLLCQRESILSLITGIPYQHFNFLHRWLGRVIYVQSALHTIVWTVVEGNLYQPQPTVYAKFIKQQYMVFGCVAMFLITFLTFFSTKWAIKKTGYEFFKITHSIVAVLYIAACWGHWDKLYCWMVPSLALIFIDQSARALRTVYIHTGGGKGRSSAFQFQCAQAEMQVLTDENGSVIRMDFDYEHRKPWVAGQHFYLTFPSLSIWQSHPFTVSSAPELNRRIQHHTYLLRVRAGQTQKLAALGNTTIPVILTGPYGPGFPNFTSPHILTIAGGTGATFTLPIVMEALRHSCQRSTPTVDFVWVVRKAEDVLWLSAELGQLKKMLGGDEAPRLQISLYITRDVQHAVRRGKGKDPVRDVEKGGALKTTTTTSSVSVSSDVSLDELLAVTNKDARFRVHWLQDHHPVVADIVAEWRERCANAGGRMEIFGSGPETMGSDLRAAVAGIDDVEGMEFYWDSRE